MVGASLGCEDSSSYVGTYEVCVPSAVDFCQNWISVGARRLEGAPETGLVRVFRGHVSQMSEVIDRYGDAVAVPEAPVFHIVVTVDETMESYLDLAPGTELIWCDVNQLQAVSPVVGDVGIYAFKMDELVPASQLECGALAPNAVFASGANHEPVIAGEGAHGFAIRCLQNPSDCSTTGPYAPLTLSWTDVKSLLQEIGLEPFVKSNDINNEYHSGCMSASYHTLGNSLVLPSECSLSGSDVVCNY